MRIMVTNQAGPTHASGLSSCERLLIRSLRLMVVNGADCPIVPHQFRCICGAGGTEVFHIFCTFLWVLVLASRKRLNVLPPGDVSKLSKDEQCLLQTIAAAQNAQPELLELYLCWLAHRPVRPLLKASVRELASALTQHQLLLGAHEQHVWA